MRISGELKDNLNLALNESTILDLEFDRMLHSVKVTFNCIMIDGSGHIPDDTRVVFHFSPVGRMACSHRLGNWNDQHAEVRKYNAEDLSEVLRSFNGNAQYGWKFFDYGSGDFKTWKDKLTFDYTANSETGMSHTVDLFTERYKDNPEIIDLRIWFDSFRITDINGLPVSIGEFVERGKKGWDQVYNGNGLEAYGIYPSENRNSADKLEELARNNLWSRLTGWW